MNNKVVGLVGKLQSGKTTAANMVINYYNLKNYDSVYKYSFADLLKLMILNAGICTVEELWEKKTEFSRMMMQKIGTEIIRKQVSNDFWVHKMKEKLSNEHIKNSLIIIDDVRFLNEANLINSFDGTLIRIRRPSLERNKNENLHLSETEQDGILVDYDILNDGSLDDLQKKMFGIMEYEIK